MHLRGPVECEEQVNSQRQMLVPFQGESNLGHVMSESTANDTEGLVLKAKVHTPYPFPLILKTTLYLQRIT